jgi:hypothetical protein
MGTSVLIDESDVRYRRIEEFIRDIYNRSYFASPAKLPPKLIARYNKRGELLCAAGMRTPKDGFFSECYLDQPIEQTLAAAIGSYVRRADICEVTALVSRSPLETGAFIDSIAAQIADLGFTWSFYTLTNRLALLLKRKGLSPIDLGPAEAHRVPSPETWGRYDLEAVGCLSDSSERRRLVASTSVVNDRRHEDHHRR